MPGHYIDAFKNGHPRSPGLIHTAVFPNSALLSLTPKNLNFVREPTQVFPPADSVVPDPVAALVVVEGDFVVVVGAAVPGRH